MIPNIIHFIYPVNGRTRPFSFLNVQAVKRAAAIHKPDRILFWTNAKPADIQYWSEIAPLVELTYTSFPDLEWPQYQSDWIRLQILHDQGGIYMDTDVLTLLPLPVFSSQRLTISWESPDRQSLSNALMISPPGNLFVKRWLDLIPEAVKNPLWAYGGVVLPALLAQDLDLADHIRILPNNLCCPLDLSKPWLFDPALAEEADNQCQNAYAIHAFETFFRDTIKHVTPEWVKQNPCLFSDLVMP